MLACFLFPPLFHFVSFHPLRHSRDHFWTCLLRESTNMRHGENTHHSASFIHVACILNERSDMPLALAWPRRCRCRSRRSHGWTTVTRCQFSLPPAGFASQPRRNSLEAFCSIKSPSAAAAAAFSNKIEREALEITAHPQCAI